MAFGAVRSLDARSASPPRRSPRSAPARTRWSPPRSLRLRPRDGDRARPLEISAITRGLNGVYEGLVEWWDDHPDVSPEQLTEWVVALVLPGLTGDVGTPRRV